MNPHKKIGKFKNHNIVLIRLFITIMQTWKLPISTFLPVDNLSDIMKRISSASFSSGIFQHYVVPTIMLLKSIH